MLVEKPLGFLAGEHEFFHHAVVFYELRNSDVSSFGEGQNPPIQTY
jgi:hypothetical protein